MADYPANGSGSVAFPAPLDPDNTAGGPNLWDFEPALGAGNLASATVTLEAGLTQVGNVAIGTYAESTSWPDTGVFTETASAAKVVQVKVAASGTARTGTRYAATVVAVDSDGTQHPRTATILVADR